MCMDFFLGVQIFLLRILYGFVRIFFQNIAGHLEEATDSDHAACVTGLKTGSHTEFGKREYFFVDIIISIQNIKASFKK